MGFEKTGENKPFLFSVLVYHVHVSINYNNNIMGFPSAFSVLCSSFFLRGPVLSIIVEGSEPEIRKKHTMPAAANLFEISKYNNIFYSSPFRFNRHALRFIKK